MSGRRAAGGVVDALLGFLGERGVGPLDVDADAIHEAVDAYLRRGGSLEVVGTAIVLVVNYTRRPRSPDQVDDAATLFEIALFMLEAHDTLAAASGGLEHVMTLSPQARAVLCRQIALREPARSPSRARLLVGATVETHGPGHQRTRAALRDVRLLERAGRHRRTGTGHRPRFRARRPRSSSARSSAASGDSGPGEPGPGEPPGRTIRRRLLRLRLFGGRGS